MAHSCRLACARGFAIGRGFARSKLNQYQIQPLLSTNKFDSRAARRCFHLSLTQCTSDPDVPFSSEKYPHFKRAEYSEITPRDIDFFEKLLEPNRVLTDPSDVVPYNIDWLRTCRGQGTLVLKPKTTKEVSEILKYCHKYNLAVVPQGGNTGLVGGSGPVFDEIVLSLQLLKTVIDFDKFSGTLVCEAGCILENLDNYLSEYGYMMPLDLGAKGSCCIGGNVSTNAGGLRLLRYGSLHGTVLGIEAVLANGEVVDCLSTLRKDNTGYDIKQLFIGSEGTLGVVTKVAIQCPVRPKAVQIAFLGLENFDNILKVFGQAKSSLAEVLSAFEFLDNESMNLTTTHLGVKNPIGKHRFYVLIEVAGSNAEHNEVKLNDFLEIVMEKGLVNDGTLASETAKMKAIWEVRERLAEAQRAAGYSYKYDVSLPLTDIYKPVEIMRKRLGSMVDACIGYGHLGDGNLHLNMVTKKFDPDVYKMIVPHLYEVVSDFKGSISAEHGMGIEKNNYIHFSKSPESVELMKQMKKLFDPRGILNPYKTLPHKHESL